MATIYTCPMHPEVHQSKPGDCPICHMRLVKPDAATAKPSRWHQYTPLIVILSLITLCAAIVSWGNPQPLRDFLLALMTGFFLVFSAFKLMDIKGFAQGYGTYDLIAKRWFGYGYVYPFIELAFGLVMLAGFHPPWLLWTEFAVMALSGLGVAIKLAKREAFMCACLGTFLKVPLTKITLIEDFGMALATLILIGML